MSPAVPIILVFALWPLLAALAEDAAAPEQMVTVSADDCRRLLRHEPRDDVTHRPGVDVRGRAVVPADVDDGARFRLPEAITFPLTVDLGSKPGRLGGEAVVGTISVELSSGRASLNGEEVSDAARAELIAACRAAYAPPR